MLSLVLFSSVSSCKLPCSIWRVRTPCVLSCTTPMRSSCFIYRCSTPRVPSSFHVSYHPMSCCVVSRVAPFCQHHASYGTEQLTDRTTATMSQAQRFPPYDNLAHLGQNKRCDVKALLQRERSKIWETRYVQDSWQFSTSSALTSGLCLETKRALVLSSLDIINKGTVPHSREVPKTVNRATASYVASVDDSFQAIILPKSRQVLEPTNYGGLLLSTPLHDLSLSFFLTPFAKKGETQTELHGPSPRASYTDRAIAYCRRS
jgi:hypothetical protein